VSKRLFFILFQIEISYNLIHALLYIFSLLYQRHLSGDLLLHQFNLLPDHFSNLEFELFVVVVDHLHFGEDFAATELIYFVGKGVGRCVGLQSQLQLGHRLLLEGDLKRYIRNGNRVVEPALHLNQSEVARFFLDELFDLVNSCNDVLDGAEDALSPDHVADREGN
jgi:hypothetical protein